MGGTPTQNGATVRNDVMAAMDRKRPRVYPGLKIAVAAMVLSALPMALMRVVMARRPRRHG